MSEDKKVLRRKMPAPFMGVCAGLAEYFDIDVLPVRILVLLFFIAVKIPILLTYVLVGMLCMEEPNEEETNGK